MVDFDLVDIKPKSSSFTWSNRRIGVSFMEECLDRFLVTYDWVSPPRGCESRILVSGVSDHKPVNLQLFHYPKPRNSPYKFNPLLIKEENFISNIQTWWRVGEPGQGSEMFRFAAKLAFVKSALKEWNIGLSKAKKQARLKLEESLSSIQEEIDKCGLSQDLALKEAETSKALDSFLQEEEECWRLKSRMLWLSAGDINTSFFHKASAQRFHRNFIGKIKNSNGDSLSTPEEIREEAISFFSTLLAEEQVDRAEAQNEILGVIPNLISKEGNLFLTKPITMEELENTIAGMKEDKSPGPDGFQVNFFKVAWDIINEDLLRCCEESRRSGKILGRMNATFIALIPKEKNPTSFHRFRPISLCNVSYKIISKLMANRLRRFFPKLIFEEQGGFVPGKLIADNVVLVQEVLHSAKARKEKTMLVKLDMAKAYDRLDRTFLLKVLEIRFLCCLEEVGGRLHFQSVLFSVDQWKSSWLFQK
eukprot:Gb_11085 [translate_table: standard]